MKQKLKISGVQFDLTYTASKKVQCVKLGGFGYKHENDHVDENPNHDTAVTVDLDSVTFNGQEMLPFMKELDLEDHIEEMKGTLLLTAWQLFREQQERNPQPHMVSENY